MYIVFCWYNIKSDDFLMLMLTLLKRLNHLILIRTMSVFSWLFNQCKHWYNSIQVHVHVKVKFKIKQEIPQTKHSVTQTASWQKTQLISISKYKNRHTKIYYRQKLGGGWRYRLGTVMLLRTLLYKLCYNIPCYIQYWT